MTRDYWIGWAMGFGGATVGWWLGHYMAKRRTARGWTDAELYPWHKARTPWGRWWVARKRAALNLIHDLEDPPLERRARDLHYDTMQQFGQCTIPFCRVCQDAAEQAEEGEKEQGR